MVLTIKMVLENHMRKFHVRYQCEKCDYNSFGYIALNDHHEKVHTSVSEIKCVNGGTELCREDKLTIHRRVHVPLRHICVECKTEDTRSEVIEAHINTYMVRHNDVSCVEAS